MKPKNAIHDHIKVSYWANQYDNVQSGSSAGIYAELNYPRLRCMAEEKIFQRGESSELMVAGTMAYETKSNKEYSAMWAGMNERAKSRCSSDWIIIRASFGFASTS